MTPALLAGVLAAIALLGMARQWRRCARGDDAGWRRALLLAGQAALAAALFFLLLPPSSPGASSTLVVLTEGAPRRVATAGGERIVALPGADAAAGIERVPDLGTALRRHPGATSIRVFGHGLPPRDHDAARGHHVEFMPAEAGVGLVELRTPAAAVRGHRFSVRGRFAGAGGSAVTLLDPAGARIAHQVLDADGRFALAAVAGPAGRMAWRLQRRDGDDAVVEDVAVPLQVIDGAPLRVLVLAGGVNPESKYLRRWATDAGLALQSQAALGGGVDIGSPVQALTAARLAELDLVILDDRAWRGLGDGGRAQLRDAVRAGLGVLLRLTADPGGDDRALLRAWGFEVVAAEVGRSVTLAGTGSADATPAGTASSAASPTGGADQAADPTPVLTRRALALTATDGLPLLRDDAGATLALWRVDGRGRVAVWNLADSFRLQLTGRRAAYASLWADAAATLARGSDAYPPAPAGAEDRRVGERSVFCGIGAAAKVRAPDGSEVALARDADAGGCAAWWPSLPGWHTLHDGGSTTAVLVRSFDDAPGLARTARRIATAALAARGRPAEATATPVPVRGPRWPWALAWLTIAAGLWWLERSRRGRGARATSTG